jgi:hypothetical protein
MLCSKYIQLAEACQSLDFAAVSKFVDENRAEFVAVRLVWRRHVPSH